MKEPNELICHCIKYKSKTVQFEIYLKSLGYKDSSLTNASWARHDRALREFLPQVVDHISDLDRNVVDIGFGSGATTHAWSHLFSNVMAFEIGEKPFEIAETRKKIYGLDNITFRCSSPEKLIDDAISVANNKTVFVLYAVLEHMTELERFTTLSKLYDFMGPDNYLYIGNTPNRLSYEDLHTHEHPFLFMLSDFTCLKYLEFNQDITMAKHLLGAYRKGGLDNFSLARIRRGVGISFHDFHIAFKGASLDECVVISDLVAPGKCYDAILGLYMILSNIEIPMCFINRDMNFLIKKPSGPEESDLTMRYNKRIRAEYKLKIKETLLKSLAKL